jgi:hypothetical protein
MMLHIMNRGDRREPISMDDADSSASSTRRAIFRYDRKRRRRVTREETKGSSGNWVLASETRYVKGGMRVIQERNGNGDPTVAYTRGPDLSGTVEGAGGIGGPLARSEWNSVSSAWSHHAFYHSDGVGNVTALAVPRGGDIALAARFLINDLTCRLITLRGTGWLMLVLGFCTPAADGGGALRRGTCGDSGSADKRAGDLHPALLARQRLSTVNHSGRRA